MGDLSRNFSRREFQCQCAAQGKSEADGYCGGRMDAVDIELVTVLQVTVDHFRDQTDCPIICIITSGNRCEKHNSDVGGSPNSQHKFSKAADFHLKFKFDGEWHQIDPAEVASFLETKYPDRLGIGRYKSWTHVDSGPMRRWGK